MQVPVLFLPLGWAEAALDEDISDAVVIPPVDDACAAFLAFGAEFSVGGTILVEGGTKRGGTECNMGVIAGV